jgi:ammonia channel protein AmtB
MLSLPGTIILGARTKRWQQGGIKGHSIPLVCLGFLILNFGFLAFNGGSQVLFPIFNVIINLLPSGRDK